MENLFVSYEIAKQLKEKGFNEPCFSAYNDVKELSQLDEMQGYSNALFDYVILAPLYQQVIDWFREKKNYYIEIKVNYTEDGVYLHYNDQKEGVLNYYEAYNLAINEALKLIPDVK